MVIVVPPMSGPEVGETAVTVGLAMYVNAPVNVELPPGVVNTTSRAPAVPDGVVNVTDVAETFEIEVPNAPPTVTEVAPVRFVPVTVTKVPPDAAPLVGEIDVITGTAT